MPLSLGTSPIKVLQDVKHTKKAEVRQNSLLFDGVVDEPSEIEYLINLT